MKSKERDYERSFRVRGFFWREGIFWVVGNLHWTMTAEGSKRWKCQKEKQQSETYGLKLMTSLSIATASDLVWFLAFCLFSMQGGEVIDKVMMIKDVHGPEAWVPKKIKNWTESRQSSLKLKIKKSGLKVQIKKSICNIFEDWYNYHS